MLIGILISLIITLMIWLYNKNFEIKELTKDYNVLLGSYKNLGQVMVSENVISQKEYDNFIKNKREK